MDEAKLKSARAGNARARAAVVRALQDRWFRYAVANLLSVSAARDAVQDAGLRVLGRLSTDDGTEPIERWSMGAVVAAVRDVRQLNGDAPPLLAMARRAGLSATPPPFRRQLADVADGLSAVLSAMTVPQREAVTLRWINRLPVGVVAGVLGVDSATVRADVAAGMRTVVARPLRPQIGACRDWLALARYPGDLRHELFRADRPRWLVPAAVGTLAASVIVVTAAHHFRPPTTGPTTVPAVNR